MKTLYSIKQRKLQDENAISQGYWKYSSLIETNLFTGSQNAKINKTKRDLKSVKIWLQNAYENN